MDNQQELIRRLEEERQQNLQLQQQLHEALEQADKAQKRIQSLERALQQTRQAAVLQRAEYAKEGKVILFGTVNPKDDPGLKLPQKGEDSLLWRGVQSLRTRGVAGTARKLKEIGKRR